MTRKIYLIIPLLCFSCLMSAQDWQFGFRTGLNTSTFKGPVEQADDGSDLESYSNLIGFHINFGFGYSFTDRFGLRGEFGYSQRGSKYTYDGQSYFIFNRDMSNQVIAYGNRTQTMNISNAYLELPVYAYGKIGRALEFFGGVYGAYMVTSVATGNMRFGPAISENGNEVQGVDENGEKVPYFDVRLNYNYFKDGIGPVPDLSTQVVFVDGRAIEIPVEINAYYDFDTDEGPLYNRWEFGLVGGVSVYPSKNLYLSARLQYGLTSVLNDAYNVSLKSLNENGSYIYLDEDLRNFSWQFSIGLLF